MPESNIDPRLLNVRVIASVSGGKDSAAMCLHLKELGIPYEAVFMDTGWEHRDTYAYLRGPLTEAIGPIRWLRAEVDLPPEKEAMAQELEGMLGHYSAMVRLVLHKGIFPARRVRWCTDYLKVKPLHSYIVGLDDDAVQVVGIRAEESEARAAMPEWEWSDKLDQWTWRPLLMWTLQDVIDIHARHGLAPNPLYLRGASRVGCWPCIFARKSEVRMIGEDAGRVAVVRRMEELLAALPGPDGEAWNPLPTWFRPMREGGDYAFPIERAVDWSRTARGGKQVELFTAPDRDTGCMRWGLCDTGTKGDKE